MLLGRYVVQCASYPHQEQTGVVGAFMRRCEVEPFLKGALQMYALSKKIDSCLSGAFPKLLE